jgi:apolipoprotein D and lipocalin family protein
MKPVAALLALFLTACASTSKVSVPSMPTLDLERFMGDWYVIANIPTRIERAAHNAVETYALADDGSIRTTFRFRKGAFDGPEKVLEPKGFVRAGTGNAVWDMQFIWPIKAEYVVSYVDADYQTTIIARSKRDWVWVMARTPQLPEPELKALLDRVAALGYDATQVQRVPQRWP